MADFKFDLQSIVNSVKSIINPEGGTPKVSEGDPIGAKIVQISTLVQSVANSHAQSAKDLNQINNLLNELYKDLEAFRKLEAELRQRPSGETSSQPGAGVSSQTQTGRSPNAPSTGASTTDTGTTTTQGPGESVASIKERARKDKIENKENINIKSEEEKLKKDDRSPLNPNRGTSRPSDKD